MAGSSASFREHKNDWITRIWKWKMDVNMMVTMLDVNG